MKGRRRHQGNLVLTILLAVGLTGCGAGGTPENTGESRTPEDVREERNAGKAEWSVTPAGTERETDVKWTMHALEAADVPARTVREKKPRSALLTVTDHRTDLPTVRRYLDREMFLGEWGFDGQEPYFEYFTEDGALQLELFYDSDFGVGCGLQYDSGGDMEPEGFLFNGSGNYRYFMDFMAGAGIGTDQYSFLSFEGGDGREEARNYEESAIYGENGRLVRYTSQGWIPWLTEKEEIQKILEIQWSYREDGTLRERSYHHNDMVFGTWYSSRQSYYDEKERLVHEHCYVTHGSVDYYYIYAGEEEAPIYCLILDHNTGLLCAELLEYHGPGNIAGEAGTGDNGTGTGMYYGRIGPSLAGETENRYAAAVLEAVKKEGKDYGDSVTHTYAADYDGDSLTEAFVIVGREIRDQYECDISGDCFFVSSDLEVSRCMERACAFGLSQQFLCQDGLTYLLVRYSIGLPWQAEMYTVREGAPAEISGSYADKYIDWRGQVIQIENTYDGNCMRTNVSAKEGEEDWKYLWTGHSWKPYTFLFDHGQLREVPAREVTREEVERIAPLPGSFDEAAPEGPKQYILRDNGELNINMAEEWGDPEGERDINFSYVTYRLDENGQWEYVEEQMGYYMVQFCGGKQWDYIKELYGE